LLALQVWPSGHVVTGQVVVPQEFILVPHSVAVQVGRSQGLATHALSVHIWSSRQVTGQVVVPQEFILVPHSVAVQVGRSQGLATHALSVHI
jgi:hypothetical protein